VEFESGVPYASVRALLQRGHEVRSAPAVGAFGGYQAIRWDAKNQVYHGASESRKDGCAMGY
jgi:gamma-glutamyltranspeptidase/glutathione hydrolase